MMVCLLKGIDRERVQILTNVTEDYHPSVVDHPSVGHPALDLPAVEDQAVEEDPAVGVAVGEM